MRLEEALSLQKTHKGKTDILELAGIHFSYNYAEETYFTEKIALLPQGEYFLSDLDGTFFRGVLQKEAFSIFSKYIRKIDATKLNIDEYYKFLQDYKFFSELEKKAYNKEIEYFEYLNAGIFLLITHSKLINWNEYIHELERIFIGRKKITPYRFSINKMKEVLLSGKNFLFISGAPDFIFEIYLSTLQAYVKDLLGEGYAKKVFGVSTHISLNNHSVMPLWGKDHKVSFIKLLQEKGIITGIIGGMGDTRSDFGISECLDPEMPFYFVNPERKVLEEFTLHKTAGINYEFILERKDLICTLDITDIKLL